MEREKFIGGDVGTSAHARLAFGGNVSSGEQASPLLRCSFATGNLLNVASTLDCSHNGTGLSSDGVGANIVRGLVLKSGASSDCDEKACGGSSTGGSCRASERVRRFAEVHEDLGQFRFLGRQDESCVFPNVPHGIRGAMHRCGATDREDSGAGESLRSESEPAERPAPVLVICPPEI